MKKNLPLIAGITIPLLLILFVAASIYLPGLFTKPKYSFLYLSGSNYSPAYFVANGQLNEHITTSTGPTVYPPSYYSTGGQPQLFVYDVGKNQSEAISFADAQKFSLNTDPQSPDGFEIVSGNDGGGGFPFFYSSSDNYNTKYLKGHDVSRKLNIPDQGNYYYNFTFLGWVTNQ